MKLKKPTVVRVYKVQVRRMGRRWPGPANETTVVERWYAVLRFGRIEKRLAVSKEAVRWLRGRRRT